MILLFLVLAGFLVAEIVLLAVVLVWRARKVDWNIPHKSAAIVAIKAWAQGLIAGALVSALFNGMSTLKSSVPSLPTYAAGIVSLTVMWLGLRRMLPPLAVRLGSGLNETKAKTLANSVTVYWVLGLIVLSVLGLIAFWVLAAIGFQFAGV
jgi:hypothetical protein